MEGRGPKPWGRLCARWGFVGWSADAGLGDRNLLITVWDFNLFEAVILRGKRQIFLELISQTMTLLLPSLF